MTHIICRASFCLFWDDGVCIAEEIIYEPDNGCLTLQDAGDLDLVGDEEDGLAWEDDSDDLFDDDDDDDWEDADEDW
ncbi:MAG: hypothetical protein PVI67_15390, partial [Anaerolineae bacterium]